ncbi:MAG: hypothetical protein KatS3mg062_1427 [Tepidiforma sp.]|nr:MAG: hypothetical protein KatS3mg062_1427 [Tepidiforma sp.]
MSLTTELRTLQEIDDELAALETALAEIDARLAHSEALTASEAAFNEADARYQELRRSQRDLEAGIADLNAKIVPEERRLYDGSVRNPKELTAIQHEVEHLKTQRGALEDRLLEVMEALETASAARAEAEARLAEARREREAETAALRARREDHAARLAAALARREAHAARIPPAALRLYDDVRRRRGHAVARIQGSSCTGCRVAIPESVRRKSFDPSAIPQCPNCERILYVG